METSQLGGKLIARSALRIAEHQEHLPAAIFFQRNRCALKIGQTEQWSGSSGLQTIPFDTTLRQGPLALQLLSLPICGFGRSCPGGGQLGGQFYYLIGPTG